MTAAAFDPYATLGIPSSASRAEAARAHRRLAKEFHPDVNPGPAAAERMRRINDAWHILSNAARRSRFDAERATRSFARGHYAASAYRQPWRSGYGQPAGRATWTTWPESRVTAPRSRRPARPEPEAPAFGDRPAVVAAVGVVLMILYFVGAWLGSIAP